MQQTSRVLTVQTHPSPVNHRGGCTAASSEACGLDATSGLCLRACLHVSQETQSPTGHTQATEEQAW